MDTVTLLLTGDVMTGRGIDQVLPHPGSPTIFEAHVQDARGYVRLAERASGPISRVLAAADLWGDALEEMQRVQPDLRIVNLETAVTTSDDAWAGKGIHYRMHPANVSCLAAAGIDCCVLANNHTLDWGRAGLAETLQTLHGAGLRSAGAGADEAAAWAPAVLPLAGGRRVLVFGCATESSGVPPDWAASARYSGLALLPDLSDATARRLAAEVARHRRDSEPVIVSIHWGANWVEQIPTAHREFAHRLIDLGAADIVHGHSSHHPLPIEVYRGRLVLHGCGDLVNDYEGIGRRDDDKRSDVGCLYFATVAASGGALRRLEIVPMQIRRFRLGAADAAARHWLERQLNRGGSAFGTEVLAQHGSNGWTLQWHREHEPAAHR